MSVPALGFVNYTCQCSVASSVKYQWIHNDTLMRNESSAVLKITNISWNETGIYHCMVTAINNVSMESNGGFLNMTSKSGKHHSHSVLHKRFSRMFISYIMHI